MMQCNSSLSCHRHQQPYYKHSDKDDDKTVADDNDDVTLGFLAAGADDAASFVNKSSLSPATLL